MDIIEKYILEEKKNLKVSIVKMATGHENMYKMLRKVDGYAAPSTLWKLHSVSSFPFSLKSRY